MKALNKVCNTHTNELNDMANQKIVKTLLINSIFEKVAYIALCMLLFYKSDYKALSKNTFYYKYYNSISTF